MQCARMQVCRDTGCRCAGKQGCGDKRMQECKNAGCRSAGMQGCRVEMCRGAGMQECRDTGVQGCRVHGCMCAGMQDARCMDVGVQGAGMQGAGVHVQMCRDAECRCAGVLELAAPRQQSWCWQLVQLPGEAAWAAREQELAEQGGGAGKGAPLPSPPLGRALSTHRLSGASHVNPGRTQPALSSFT